jgi:hypothetical protein
MLCSTEPSDVFGPSYRDATLSADVDDGTHVDEALDIVDGDLLRLLLYGSSIRAGTLLYVVSVSLLEPLVIAGGGSTVSSHWS